MLYFKTSLASAILTFILFAGGIGMETAFSQENKTGSLDADTLFKLYYACLMAEVHHDKNKDNIANELVDNGTISTYYKGWTCKHIEKVQNDLDNLRDSLHAYSKLRE
jgi:hypothetical protein